MSIGQRPLDRRGVAASEFAIILPTFLFLLGGIADLGQAMYCRTMLANAVAAGAQYAAMNTGSPTTDVIVSMVKSVSSLSGTALSVTVSYTGYCITGTPPAMTAATANSTCADGTSAGQYAAIRAGYTVNGLFGAYSPANLISISDSATVRVQ